jgi:hypothetical protein
MITKKQIRKLAGETYPYPVRVVDGDKAPELVGNAYWKTGFTRHYPGGTFSRILYTPSTRRVEVGQQWLAAHDPEVVYNNDDH